MNKYVILPIIFCGEALMIFAEMWGAKQFQLSGFWNIFWKMLIVQATGGAMLVTGYLWGYAGFKNIWIISAVSITSILLIEPILAFLIFHEIPTKGAGVGLILGAVGLSLALFWK